MFVTLFLLRSSVFDAMLAMTSDSMNYFLSKLEAWHVCKSADFSRHPLYTDLLSVSLLGTSLGSLRAQNGVRLCLYPSALNVDSFPEP